MIPAVCQINRRFPSVGKGVAALLCIPFVVPLLIWVMVPGYMVPAIHTVMAQTIYAWSVACHLIFFFLTISLKRFKPMWITLLVLSCISLSLLPILLPAFVTIARVDPNAHVDAVLKDIIKK